MKLLLELLIKIFRKITTVLSETFNKNYSENLNLDITYELISSLPANVFEESSNNARGTHLNESGDTREVEEYVQTFSLEQEINNLSVIENLLFIDTFIAHLLPIEAEVVDVGCGIGRYGKFLHRQGAPTEKWKYAGVDRTEDILNFSRYLCPEYEFKSSENSIKIPYPNHSKDLVFASGMLQCTCHQWIDALIEMHRVSRKYICISRLPILRRHPSAYCHQKVIEKGKIENHYNQLFNRQEFESKVTELGCRIVTKDYSSEILFVKGISEPVVLNHYLLEV